VRLANRIIKQEYLRLACGIIKAKEIRLSCRIIKARIGNISMSDNLGKNTEN